MSEEFDKEAEREKLREKYEQDKQKREQTEQMSELLLKGATMTNAHCSECSDPIFRYDGQEFCPTCEKPVDRQGESDESQSGGGDEQIEVTSPSDEARITFGAAGESEDEDGTATSESRAADGTRTGQQRASARAGDETASESRESGVQRHTRPEAGDAPRSAGKPAAETEIPGIDPGAGGVEAARQSLVRTLVHFSDRAEREADPREAEAYLGAAREAAEALAALRR